MVAAIKQTVTVGPGGRIEIPATELHQGDQAEVIVLVERANASASERLAAFDKLVKSLNLTEAKAQEWIRMVQEERKSFGPGE